MRTILCVHCHTVIECRNGRWRHRGYANYGHVFCEPMRERGYTRAEPPVQDVPDTAL